MSLKIEADKSYTLNIPSIPNCKIHVDYILDSKCYDDEKLIVFRYWIKHKKLWQQSIISMFELELYNK